MGVGVRAGLGWGWGGGLRNRQLEALVLIRSEEPFHAAETSRHQNETLLAVGSWNHVTTDVVARRYGAITVGNIQKSIPASFGGQIPPMIRKIAVRRSAQVRRGDCGGGGGRVVLQPHLSPAPPLADCVQVFYNNKGYHSMPTYLNVLNNAILRANLPASKGNPAAYGTAGTA